ncbi:MAG: twin-arginine translocase TatA/TatE family subunit [Proteobacteria bacterium]|nr:twin-arginine translocase TatA/TatE family subunit [Pseudomonadota bacterium]
MFGIGLPEMILIMALALIVIGPDKLPDLARSLAKGLMELKKTAESLKTSFAEEGNPLDEIRPELEEAAKSLKTNLLDPPPQLLEQRSTHLDEKSSAHMAAEAYQELMKQTGKMPVPENMSEETAIAVQDKSQIKAPDKPDDNNVSLETGKNTL